MALVFALTIHQFHVDHRVGSGKAAWRSLAMRRRPLVNQDSLERATFFG